MYNNYVGRSGDCIAADNEITQPRAFNNITSLRPWSDPPRRHVELDGALQPSRDLTISNRFVRAVERERKALVREGLWSSQLLLPSVGPFLGPYQLICSKGSTLDLLPNCFLDVLYYIFLGRSYVRRRTRYASSKYSPYWTFFY